MAPFATFYHYSDKQGLETRKIHAIAKFNNLELVVPPDFVVNVSNKEPEYLAKFPLGKVPGLSRGDFHLYESLAIAQYLAGHGPAKAQLLGATPEEQAKVAQFLAFTSAHLSPTLYKVGAWRRNSQPYREDDETVGAKDLKRWLDFFEAELSRRLWLVDIEGQPGPSLADLVVGERMYFAFKVYVDADMRKEYPALVEWYQRLTSLPETKEIYEGEMIEKRRIPEERAE